MIDPSEPLCGPSTCLRAEAEDLRERAQQAIRDAERVREGIARSTAKAVSIEADAANYLTLANRYERAASMLDEAGEQEAQNVTHAGVIQP